MLAGSAGLLFKGEDEPRRMRPGDYESELISARGIPEPNSQRRRGGRILRSFVPFR